MKLAVFLVAALMLAAERDTVRFGPGGAFQLDYGRDNLAVGIAEGAQRYPLPQSTLEDYRRLRPADLQLNPIWATGGKYERDETIGPHQVEGGRLWFGKSFYDAEGERGVGAFGYFDTATRKYTLFSPKDVAPYEVSAILVEPDTVWLALDQSVEDISHVPGGLAVWDRRTRTIRRYPVEFNILSITRQGSSLRLTTNAGYALFENGGFQRFRVEGASATPIERFPPPPSKD